MVTSSSKRFHTITRAIIATFVSFSFSNLHHHGLPLPFFKFETLCQSFHLGAPSMKRSLNTYFLIFVSETMLDGNRHTNKS